jgi:AmmeMemoRadiSam system protein A
LRGCIGTLAADRPLWETVVAAAVGAAARDPRFQPVEEVEVPSLSIDVSVLGPPVPLRDPADLRPGVHGVIVDRGGRRGLLLPEVALDQGWDAIDMLEGTCRKAGLPSDAWREPGTRVYLFRTARVSDHETAGAPVAGPARVR